MRRQPGPFELNSRRGRDGACTHLSLHLSQQACTSVVVPAHDANAPQKAGGNHVPFSAAVHGFRARSELVAQVADAPHSWRQRGPLLAGCGQQRPDQELASRSGINGPADQDARCAHPLAASYPPLMAWPLRQSGRTHYDAGQISPFFWVWRDLVGVPAFAVASWIAASGDSPRAPVRCRNSMMSNRRAPASTADSRCCGQPSVAARADWEMPAASRLSRSRATSRR